MILQRPVALREQEVVLHEEQVGREVRSKAGGWFGIMDPPSLSTIIIIIIIINIIIIIMTMLKVTVVIGRPRVISPAVSTEEWEVSPRSDQDIGKYKNS